MAAAAAGKAVTEAAVVAATGAGAKVTGTRKAAAARKVATGVATGEVVALAEAAAGTKAAVVRVTGTVGVKPTVTEAKGSAWVARGRRERRGAKDGRVAPTEGKTETSRRVRVTSAGATATSATKERG